MEAERRRRVGVLIAAGVVYWYLRYRRRKPRRFWIRPSLIEKKARLVREKAREDDSFMEPEDLVRRSYFKAFTRKPQELFEHLHDLVKGRIEKQITRFRKPFVIFRQVGNYTVWSIPRNCERLPTYRFTAGT